jgi:hypothetical protein
MREARIHGISKRRDFTVTTRRDKRQTSASDLVNRRQANTPRRVLHARRHLAQVVQRVAKGHFQLRELLEVVAHDVLVRHADAAVQLHRLLAHEAHGLAQLHLGAGHGARRSGAGAPSLRLA